PTLFLGCRAPPEESTAHDGAVSSPAPPESIQEPRRPGRRTSHAIRAAASPKLQDPQPLRSDCPASPPAEPRPGDHAPCTATSASPPGPPRPILGDFRCPQKRGKPRSGSLDVNLKLFDLLGRVGVTGLWTHWTATRTSEAQ